MPKRTGAFRKIDVTRAIEACKAGGMPIGRVELIDGKITIISATEVERTTELPLDQWMKTNAR